MSNDIDNIPTPKADLLRHIQNFGEASAFFSGALGLSLATVYFRQLEIVLALAYVITIIYTVLEFGSKSKGAFFRFLAITLGVLVGIREILIYYWTTALTVILIVLAVGVIGVMAWNYMARVLSAGGDNG